MTLALRCSVLSGQLVADLDRPGPQPDCLVDLGLVHHQGGDHAHHVVVGPTGEQEETTIGGRALGPRGVLGVRASRRAR